jgi:hypothetical protein
MARIIVTALVLGTLMVASGAMAQGAKEQNKGSTTIQSPTPATAPTMPTVTPAPASSDTAQETKEKHK